MRPSLAADEPPGRVDCLINNLNDAVALGLFPILFSTQHLSLTQIGLLGALYPAFWGIAQLGTGALSHRIGRKWLISTGIPGASRRPGTRGQQHQLGPWIVGRAARARHRDGLANPASRDRRHHPPDLAARAIGVYRRWRDAGLAAGAVLADLIVDPVAPHHRRWVVAALTVGCGLIVVARMYQTHSRSGPSR
jgi:hypothetical protein